jgi:predicted transcriptional regulator
MLYTIENGRLRSHELDDIHRAGDADAKQRLERLAKSTGRSRSFLAAEAIYQYLEVNEWQVAGIKQAIASLDRGERVAHEQVKDWVTSCGSRRERPIRRR